MTAQDFDLLDPLVGTKKHQKQISQMVVSLMVRFIPRVPRSSVKKTPNKNKSKNMGMVINPIP